MTNALANKWEELAGKNRWTNLLNPIPGNGTHVDLRRYIIHYGERAGAADDLVIDGKLIVSPMHTASVGLPRYKRRELFEKVGLVKGNPYKYEVRKYVYGVQRLKPNRKSNLVAYVACSTDEGSKALGRRDILVAWRGNKLDDEVVVDGLDKLVAAPIFEDDDVMVHEGWYAYYTHSDRRSAQNELESARDQVNSTVKQLIDQFGENSLDLSITVTGRGTGAALALLNVADLVHNGINDPKKPHTNPCLVTGVLFGCPRVGNEAFRKLCDDDQKLSRVLRVANELDPTINFPEIDGEEYKHVGVEMKINTSISIYLKNPKEDSTRAKELEVYLHGVAGQKGIDDAYFEWEGVRDLFMVNKTLDIIDENKYNVPAKWFFHKYMVQNGDGKWEFVDCHVEDDA